MPARRWVMRCPASLGAGAPTLRGGADPWGRSAGVVGLWFLRFEHLGLNSR